MRRHSVHQYKIARNQVDDLVSQHIAAAAAVKIINFILAVGMERRPNDRPVVSIDKSVKERVWIRSAGHMDPPDEWQIP
jgi:ribosomal protein L31E